MSKLQTWASKLSLNPGLLTHVVSLMQAKGKL